ncbi:MAG: DUF1643 domain-containing protein [Gammaproteobacteria bacterium]|nr:DUF1643 domain-containing protein [Gammaproteobacteria bacterium]MYD20273.1 DUF1643 domain-containing protein [Rhodothermaceae bacterium]MYG11376.1 DUF1643 domain-containing protein [Gammaproteobacteria bacterium]MYK28893.1 DUF1643 domain-containing protein [Gammaproteobacteria bacterium]
MRRAISIRNTCVYSDDATCRFSLTRSWDVGQAKLLFVMHNPAQATEVMNDETVMTCQNLTYAIGIHAFREEHHLDNGVILPDAFGSVRICNLFPAIARDPGNMAMPPAATLEANDRVIKAACRWADRVICAWGNLPSTRLPQAIRIDALVRDNVEARHLLCFGVTTARQPFHPRGVKSLGGQLRGLPLEAKMLRRLTLWLPAP